MVERFSIVSNDLLRGSAPTPEELAVFKERWGVQQIISLDWTAGMRIKNACTQLGLNQLFLPVFALRDPNLMHIDRVGAKRLINGKISYVHCLHGKDRTGMFVGRYRTEDGWSAKKAVEEAVKFGFCLGLSDAVAESYLKVINHGPDAGKPVTLKEYQAMAINLTFCHDCGYTTDKNNFCEHCETLPNLDVTQKVREADIGAIEGESQGVSDLWNSEESGEAVILGSKKRLPKLVRQGVVAALYKHITAQDKQLSSPISENDVKTTEALIKQLDKFANLIDILVQNQITRFIDLFKSTQGITYEVIEELEAEPYFINLGKNLKKNIWRMVGDRYLDLNEDIDEDKHEKENVESEQQKQQKKDVAMTIFDLCLDGLSKFNKDTHIGPMQKSLEEAVKGLADLVVDLSAYIEEKLDSEDMQQNILKSLESIQDQSAIIKSLVKDRIIYTLNKDVLGKDKPYENKADNSVLKQIITQEQG